MNKVGMSVTYTPTAQDFPMSADKPQAALITDWNEETEKASLAVFPKNQPYFYVKEGAVEGTVSGTFQQPATGTGGGTGGTTHSASTKSSSSQK